MYGRGEGVERVGENIEEAPRPVPGVGAAGAGSGEGGAGVAHASRGGGDVGGGTKVQDWGGSGAVEDAVEQAKPRDTSAVSEGLEAGGLLGPEQLCSLGLDGVKAAQEGHRGAKPDGGAILHARSDMRLVDGGEG